jgi:hypothetical protein
MTFRDGILGVANAVRGIPQSLGLRPTTVTLRTRVWSGGRKGEGVPTDTESLITPTPRVREVSMNEINASGGQYVKGDLRIGPITPPNVNGGYTMAQLDAQSLVNGTEHYLVLTGELAGDFSIAANFVGRGNASFFLIAKRRLSSDE